jgi:hypothetical protein
VTLTYLLFLNFSQAPFEFGCTSLSVNPELIQVSVKLCSAVNCDVLCALTMFANYY